MAAIDVVVNAALEGVKKSGALESGVLLGTVTSIGAGGTLQVERGTDVYPKVRILASYLFPKVGDLVEILKTAGGWVCIASLRTSGAPRIQSGTLSVTSATANEWSAFVQVTFPFAFAATPVVAATPQAGGPTVTGELEVKLTAVSTTGFQISQRRGTAAATVWGWIATDF